MLSLQNIDGASSRLYHHIALTKVYWNCFFGTMGDVDLMLLMLPPYGDKHHLVPIPSCSPVLFVFICGFGLVLR